MIIVYCYCLRLAFFRLVNLYESVGTLSFTSRSWGLVASQKTRHLLPTNNNQNQLLVFGVMFPFESLRPGSEGSLGRLRLRITLGARFQVHWCFALMELQDALGFNNFKSNEYALNMPRVCMGGMLFQIS